MLPTVVPLERVIVVGVEACHLWVLKLGVEVVIGEESLMHLAVAVVAVEVVVVVTLDEIETGTEISIDMILEFLLQGEMNRLHLEVDMEAEVIVEGAVGAIGVHDRGPVRGPHREEGTVTIDPSFPLVKVVTFPVKI